MTFSISVPAHHEALGRAAARRLARPALTTMYWRVGSLVLLFLCTDCHSKSRQVVADLGMADLGATDLGVADSAIPDQSVNKSWVQEDTPVTDTLYGVWGSGPTDIYAVGFGGVILHSTGDGVWQQQQTPLPTVFGDVFGSGPDEIYAAAVDSCIHPGCALDGGRTPGGLFRSTGNGIWTDVTPSAIVVASSVWLYGHSQGYVAGADYNGYSLLHLHEDGSFTNEVLPSQIGRVRGSSASDVYALGGYGLIYHSSGDGNWSQQATDDMGAPLFFDQIPGVWPVTPNDVYVVGENSLVIHSTGNNDWTQQTVPQLSAIPVGVWASGPSDVYVVTGGTYETTGDILHSDGSGVWTRQRGGVAPALYAVWGSGPGDVYAVGDAGTVLHWK